MPLEPSFDNIDDLDPLNPFGSDPKSEGAPHLRGIKSSLIANVTGSALETRLLVAAVAEVIASNALLRLVRPDPGAYALQGEDSVGVNGVIEFDPTAGVNFLDAGGVKVSTDILASLRLLNPTALNGLALELEATTGKGAIRETDGAGAPGNAWETFDPGAGVNLLFDDVIRFSTLPLGAEIRSAIDEAMGLTLINSVGGYLITDQAITGQLLFVQLGPAGNVEANVMILNRGAQIQLFHNNQFALDTADVSLNNTGANVHTSGAVQPVGFNVLPRLDVETGREFNNADSGMMVRTNQPVTMSVPLTSLPTDFTCVILNSSPGTVTIQGTLGAAIRLYTGSSLNDGTVFLASGSVATISRAGSSTVFEMWGNGASQ